jgi:hypothetical protein
MVLTDLSQVFSPAVRQLVLQSTVLTDWVQTLFLTWSYLVEDVLRLLKNNSLQDKPKKSLLQMQEMKLLPVSTD